MAENLSEETSRAVMQEVVDGALRESICYVADKRISVPTFLAL